MVRHLILGATVLLVAAHTAAGDPPKAKEAVRWGPKEEELLKTFWFKAPRPTLTIPKVAAGPAIDGSAEDACWKGASVIDFLTATRGFNSQPPSRFGIDGMFEDSSTVRLCYDAEYLYMHFTCMERLMPMLHRTVTERDGSVWSDDCIEVFFDTDLGRGRNYHVIINPNGAVYDALDTGILRTGKVTEDKAWSMKGEKVAAKLYEDRWEVEAAFPFASLGGQPKPGQAWGANFCRQRRAATIQGIWTYGTWAGQAYGFYGAPDQLGDIVFGEAGMRVAVLPQSFLGNGRMVLRVTEPARAMELTAHVEVVNDSDEKRASQPVRVVAPAGKTTDIEVPYQVDITGIQYATLAVKAGDRTVLAARRGFTVTPIQPLLDAVSPRLKKLRARSQDPVFLQSIDAYIAEIDRLSAEVKATQARFAAGPMDDGNRPAWEKLYERAAAATSTTTYIVWAKNPYLATGPDDFPAKFEDITEVTIHAAQNEYEAAGLMITNLSEEHLDLVVRNGPAGVAGLKEVRSPAMTASKTIVEENPDALAYDTVRGFNLPEETGEPLARLGTLREMVVPPLSSRQLFLLFHTAGLTPQRGGGGELLIYPLNKPFAPKRVIVRLRVWPFEIPTRADLGVHLYDYAGRDDQLADLAAHKVNTFLTADNGTFRLDKDGKFVHDMTGDMKGTQNKLKHGRKGWAYGICAAFHKWATTTGKMTEMGPEYVAAWRETVRSLVAAHKTLGLNEEDIYVCAWDEAAGKDADICIAMLKVLREEAPKLKVALTVQCKPEQREQLVGLVNVWVPGGGYIWDPKFYGARKAAGDEVWSYLCKTPVRSQLPLSYFRHFGWRAEQCGLDGIAIFAWSYLVYDFNGEVIPTRGYEALRQGIEDWQYFHLLRQEIARVRPKEPKLADAAEQARREVLDSMFKLGPWPKASEAQIAPLFEEGRVKLAEQIVKLRQAR